MVFVSAAAASMGVVEGPVKLEEGVVSEARRAAEIPCGELGGAGSSRAWRKAVQLYRVHQRGALWAFKCEGRPRW